MITKITKSVFFFSNLVKMKISVKKESCTSSLKCFGVLKECKITSAPLGQKFIAKEMWCRG